MGAGKGRSRRTQVVGNTLTSSEPRSRLSRLERFIQKVDLEGMHNYAADKRLEQNLPKELIPIALLTEAYWVHGRCPSFEEFWDEFKAEKVSELHSFFESNSGALSKSTADAIAADDETFQRFYDEYLRAMEARVFRTWCGFLTQVQAARVAELVFGAGNVEMSEELDVNEGVDFRVNYRGIIEDYDVKIDNWRSRELNRGKPRRRSHNRTNLLRYKVPRGVHKMLAEPMKRVRGEEVERAGYKRAREEKGQRLYDNGFVVFTPEFFLERKKAMDAALKKKNTSPK
jgi:hypothetical protein